MRGGLRKEILYHEAKRSDKVFRKGLWGLPHIILVLLLAKEQTFPNLSIVYESQG